MTSTARALAVVLLSAASAGCCGFVERDDAAGSREFLAGVLVRQTSDGARDTVRSVGSVHCALRDEWDASVAGLAGTCRLYGTGSSR